VGSFYDSHDLWHFFSALALLGNSLIFFHMDLNANYKGQKLGERTRIHSLLSSDADVNTRPGSLRSSGSHSQFSVMDFRDENGEKLPLHRPESFLDVSIIENINHSSKNEKI